MLVLYAITVCVLDTLWLAMTLLGLPGNWLIVGTAAGAWWLTDKALLGTGTLIALTGMALIGEVLEFMLGAAGAKKSGGSRRGALGAILGAIIGGVAGTFVVPIPIVGSIAGACGGAFIGAMALELHKGRSATHAAKIGQGAAIGRLLGTVTKLSIGTLMWLTTAIAAFWP
jgi:uncharacterized protein YqgC (DUF456 family)